MAIEFDAASSLQQIDPPVTSVTFAFSTTGSNRLLLVGVLQVATGSDVVSSVTYNGVALTRINTVTFLNGNRRNNLYYLLAPATGSNNCVVTLSSGIDNSRIHAFSYTGVRQSDQPDASNTNSHEMPYTSTTIANVSVTTVAANCRIMGFGGSMSGGFTVDVNTTKDGGGAAYWCVSRAVTTAGAYTIGGTQNSSNWAVCAASFAPALPDNGGFFFRFMSIAAPTVGLAAASSYLSWLTNVSI